MNIFTEEIFLAELNILKGDTNIYLKQITFFENKTYFFLKKFIFFNLVLLHLNNHSFKLTFRAGVSLIQ